MSGRAGAALSFLQLGARAQKNTWWQWSTRKRCFSTNLGSPHGPKEAELVVFVRTAPESRRLPTAIGDGVSRKEESYQVLDGRHLVKDGQHVKHNDRGAGWRYMVGNKHNSARASRYSGVVFRAPLVALCRIHAMMGGGNLH